MDSLVKKLQTLLENNQDLLAANPHILERVKQEMMKAYDDEDEYQDYSDYEDSDDSDDSSSKRDQYGFDAVDDYDDTPGTDDDDGFSEDEDLKGLSVKDASELEGDDADKWLKDNDSSSKPASEPTAERTAPPPEDELESMWGEDAEVDDSYTKKPEAKEAAPKESAPDEDEQHVESDAPAKAYGGKWKPNEANYQPHHHEKIKELTGQGFSHREAERMAGAHATPDNFHDAFHSTHDQEAPSSAFLEKLRPHADQFLTNWNSMRRRTADASKNPELYHTGKISEAVDTHRKPFEQAFKEYQDSDEYKNMDMFDQMDASSKFKKQYHEQNPDHAQSFVNMSTAQHAKDAKDQYKQSIDDHWTNLLTTHMQGEGAMSSKAAGQHLGGEKTEGGAYQTSTKKDPVASFVEQNPHIKEQAMKRVLSQDKYQKIMSPEQLDRLTRVHGIKGGKTGGSDG